MPRGLVRKTSASSLDALSASFSVFLGIIATLLVMYGGYLWMTAHGDTERVDEARKVLTNAGIGLVIVLSSLAITQFVLNAPVGAWVGGSSSSGDAVEMIDPFSTALGAGGA